MIPTNQFWFNNGEQSIPLYGPVSTLQTNNTSYYFFNGDVVDSYGVNNGTPTDITYASSSAVFNGTTSRVKLCDGKIDTLSGTTGTFAAEIYLTSIGVDANPSIFSYGGDTVPNNPYLSLSIFNTGGVNYATINVRDMSGGGSIVRGHTPIALNTTYKIVYGYTGSAYIIFVNGVRQTLTTVVGSPYIGWFNNVTVSANPETNIGVRKVIGLYLDPFTGRIKKASYWNRLLSDYEIANLYNLGNGNDYSYTPGGVAASDIPIFTADASHTRWQNYPPVLMNNNKYLVPVIRFNNNPNDAATAVTRLYDSSNLSTLNYIGTEIGITAGIINNFMVGSGVRSNGDLYFIFFQTKTGGLTSKLMYATSSDNGVTLSSLSTLRDNALEYVNPPIDGIFVTNTGRWLFPFDLLTSGTPSTGNYEGKVMYSDDQGLNWTTPATAIISPDNQCLESCYYYNSDGDLVRIFRSKLGPYYACNSTDDGVTYGAVYDSGLLYNVSQPNNISVKKLTGGGYIASLNITSRQYLFIAYSLTGKANEWTYYYLNIDAGSGEQISPLCTIERGNYLYCYYMKSSASLSLFSMGVYKLYKPSYPLMSV